MISPVFLLGLCRLALDGAALFLWGMALMLLTLVADPLRTSLWQRLSVWRKLLCGLVALAVVVSLPVQASILGEGWRDALRLDMLADVANGTSIGTAWWCQLAALFVLMVCWRMSGLASLLGCAAGSGILLVSLALTGHAVMDDGCKRWAHQASDLLHVGSVGAWMGALPVVLLVLSRQCLSVYPALAKQILRRFSNVGHAVVALVLLSGLCNTWLILGGLPLDWRFPYQVLLALKILVAVMMVLIAIFNRYVLVPAMRHDRSALDRLRRLSLLEIGLGWLALLLLAWLGMLQPN
ncbi:copper resistance protein CopD [Herbaspirillum rubrisubalbicans]|uniref:Copper resistance protein CopD n=1 Tax=Herbaspirillum rubrisubalbicans TaxID=80842 RepID=A0AAD0UA25_9BURK|nr:copper resistance protein CopD [Herbaspirillum rubrisubalbicans]